MGLLGRGGGGGGGGAIAGGMLMGRFLRPADVGIPNSLVEMANFPRMIAGRELDDPKIRDVIRVEALLGSGEMIDIKLLK